MTETTTETTKKSRSTGFYENKGMSRATVIFNKGYLERLNEIADHHSISKGDVIEVLLDHCDLEPLAEHLAARKRTRTRSPDRLTKAAVVKKMKDISPEKLEAINKILNGEGA